jgi:cell division protein FtsB
LQLSFESQTPDNVASERLRKAIERNRAKQSKRSGSATAKPSAPPRPTPASFSAARSASATASPTNRSMNTSASTSRKSVARVDDVEFTRDIVPGSSNGLGSAGYTKAKRKVSTKKRSGRRSNKESQYVDYVVRACWVFALVLLGRLVLSGGGVVDYYQSVSSHQDKLYQLERIGTENQMLAGEIKKIQNNSSYQKKIVRDHLGYIARDEYLILFQKETPLQTSM